jgi:hypothetical protein
MPRLLIVGEGKGERHAVPKLVSRLLVEHKHDTWFVDGDARRLGGLPVLLSRPQGTIDFIRRKNPDAALLLYDLDDGCPKEEVQKAAALIRVANLPFPVAIVLAKCEYEAWMLASIESVSAADPRLPEGLTCDVDPESIRDAKGWLTARLPDGISYKPTFDQTRYTSAIDVALAAERSRSFRRLCHAVDELVAGGAGAVTP